MTKNRILIIAILTMCIFVLSSCSDNSSSDQSKRKRRSEVKTSSSKDKDETTTTSTVKTSDTIAINEQPFLKPAELKTKWTETTLCGLISSDQAKAVLEMQVAPTPTYSYNENIGSNCTWASGDGDNAYIEISNMSYDNARIVDSSLNASGTPIIISGVAGVTKSNTVGNFVELNYSGAKANQWIVNAPSADQAKKMAENLIAALNARK